VAAVIMLMVITIGTKVVLMIVHKITFPTGKVMPFAIVEKFTMKKKIVLGPTMLLVVLIRIGHVIIIMVQAAIIMAVMILIMVDGAEDADLSDVVEEDADLWVDAVLSEVDA